MLRFALYRQVQNSPVCPRCHAVACRGARTYRSDNRERTIGLGYRPAERNLQPSTDRRNGLLPARSVRVSTLGEIR
jgi:hypothetical protein